MPIARDEGRYLVPVALVHWAITSIILGIITIGGYMVIWAVNDASWKASQQEKLSKIESSVVKMELMMSVVPTNTEKIRQLEDKVRDIQDQHKRMGVDR